MLTRRRRWLLRLLMIIIFALLAAVHVLITSRLNSLKSEEGSYANIHKHSIISSRDSNLRNVSKYNSRLERVSLKLQGSERNYSWVLDHLEKAQKARGQQANLREEAQNRIHNSNTLIQTESLRNLSLQNRMDDPSLVKLREHGVTIPEGEIHTIPSWSQITDILGEEPVVLGLEMCEQYRDSVAPKDRYVGVSGSFNTGTNLFPVLFRKSCRMEREAIIPQVPWGKHNLADARLNNFRLNKTAYDSYRSEDVLPVVMVRHPISWMSSTCVHSYAVHWKHGTDENCPNLVDMTTGKQNSVKVGYGYRGPSGNKFYKYDSLIHFWRHWYQSYSYSKLQNNPNSTSFPRLIVRLEDIVYQPDKVINAICDCVGGTRRRGKVELPEESIKTIAERNRKMKGLDGTLTMGRETSGLLKAWIDHASTASLWKNMTSWDKDLVKQVLLRDDEHKLMEQFHYKLEGQ